MVRLHVPAQFWLLLLLGVSMDRGYAQTTPAPDRRAIFAAAQDSTGTIWGSVAWAYKPLCRWQNGDWQAVDFPPVENANAMSMARTPSGAVVCLWGQQNGHFLLTWHKGSVSRLLARFSVPTDSLRFFCDSSGGLWLVGDCRQIRRISPAGVVSTAYTMLPEQFFARGRPRSASDGCEPVYAMEDGRKRLWFWSDWLAGIGYSGCLQGVVIWDGKTWSHHPTFAGVPDKPYSVIVPKDSSHCWVSVPDQGLYVVDTTTLRGTQVAPPAPGDFQGIERIFQNGQDWYALDWRNNDGAERWVNAWRLRGGRWQKIIHGIDKITEYAGQPQRAWLATPDGLWLSAFGAGAYWIPRRAGAPRPVDWRSGVPLTSITQEFPLPGGRLLLTGNSGSIAVSPRPPPARPSATRIVPMDTDCTTLVPDADHHLWGLPRFRSETRLGEWDGRQWSFHAMPPASKKQTLTVPATDSQGHVWLWSGDEQGGVFIYIPAAQKWLALASFRTALLAHLGILGFGLRGEPFEPMPQFSSDGQTVCYKDQNDRVVVYHGKAWQAWTPGQVSGNQYGSFDGPPFFNKAGNICVNTQSSPTPHSWEWTSASGWHPVAYEVGPEDFSVRDNYNSGPLPSGSVTSQPDSRARDDQGATWYTWRGALYKTIFGLSFPQFAPNTSQPFLDGRALGHVFHDSGGNTWLQTDSGGNPEYVFLAAARLLETRINSASVRLDTAKFQFVTAGNGPRWFVWRLDDGAWSAPQRAAHVGFDYLANGTHQLDVITLDARLHLTPVPAHLQFAIRVDAGQQMARLIALLEGGTDEERETAVAALRRQPILAVPALRAARPAASESGRWWIDAALQQITGDGVSAPLAADSSP